MPQVIRGGGSLASLASDASPPADRGYAFRILDRQRLLGDYRLVDYPRPPLWGSHGPRQVYLTSLLTTTTGRGPVVFACAHVPDRHHFSGRGGKDVMPLWRDPDASEPNVAPGLVDRLGAKLNRDVTPEHLLAYIYGVLCCPAYSERFQVELEEPGPRVPITLDTALFEETVAVGAELLFLHTYGERYVTHGRQWGVIPAGEARATVGVSQAPDRYPNDVVYDEAAKELRVGDGVFALVRPEVWAYEVSGWRVVPSWLGYRMRERAGRKTSPLDRLQPQRWTTELTEELLRLLWILERTLQLGHRQEKLLSRILAGDLLLDADQGSPPVPARDAPVFDGQETLQGFEAPGDQPRLNR